MKSAKSRQKWESVSRLHLALAFGDLFVDAIRRTDIKAWKESMGEMIQAGELHPNTANDRLALLGRTLAAAAVEFEWERNPITGIDRFDNSEHPTYTEEEPNSLTVEEVRKFLAALKAAFPQDFAMATLGWAASFESPAAPAVRSARGREVGRERAPGPALSEGWGRGDGDDQTKKRQKLFRPTELLDALR